MSIDSSSKQHQNIPKVNQVPRVVLLVLGTVGLFFVGQVIGVYLMYFVLSALGFGSNEVQALLSNNLAVQFATVLIIEIVTIGILWWLHHFKNQNFWKLIGLDSRPKVSFIGWAVIIYGLYFLTLIISVAVIKTLIPSLDVDQMQRLGFDSASGGGLIFVFITLVILPPIAEEIIFRGFLYQRLRGLITIYPAAIISSVIFALAHTEFLGDNPLNWIAAIDTFIFSFFLIFLLQKTKSLWPSIFLHGIKNCIAFTVLFIL